MKEDYTVCVETHRNYAAGAYSPGSPRRGGMKKGVQYFQMRVAEALV